MVSRAGWTDEEHRAGHRLPHPVGTLGRIVSMTPEGVLELDENLADEEAGDDKWSES